MKKTVVIHQPDFLPYLGFFHRLLYAEVFVVLDHVQFTRGGSDCWIHRDKIKTANGVKWLTIQVKKCEIQTPINEVILSDTTDWKTNNLNKIQEAYRKTPFFEEIFPHIENLYSHSCIKMSDFNVQSIKMLFELFDIKIDMVFSSSLNPTGKKSEMLMDLLKKVDATRYLSGIGAKDYLDYTPFYDSNIEISWQEFKHPVYQQVHGEFIPYLSSIDLLFNCGMKKSREILRDC